MDNRSMTADVKKTLVPALHPGLNDLIRVLGKQAHCSSRTLIVCEPLCPKPTYSESKYHKNCGSPKKGRSWDSLCRPSSLWSPVRAETYYYDCFFYRQYPDRDSEYQEIEDKYNAIKQQKLDYSPPVRDKDRIKAIVSGESLNKTGGARYTSLADNSKTSTGARGEKQGGNADDWSGPGALRKKDLGELSMGSQRDQKHLLGRGSKRNMISQEDFVPCAELAEIRDLLKKSDRETIRRMQEMLTLMKELSVRDICRATCDGSRGGRFETGGTKEAMSKEDMHVSRESKARMEQVSDFRKRKGGDVSEYGFQDKKTRYQHRGDSIRHSGEADDYEPQERRESYVHDDAYGPKGSKKRYQLIDDSEEDYGSQGKIRSYQQRNHDDYGGVDSVKSYQHRDYDQQPSNSKKPYQRDSLRKRKGENDGDNENGDYYNAERQESKTSYSQGESSKKKKSRADDEGQPPIRSSQQKEHGRKTKKEFDDDDGAPAENEEETREDYTEPPLVLDIKEPRSLLRHPISPNISKGKFDTDNESLSSTSDSERSMKMEQPSSRKGKEKTHNAVSESDTELTESCSSMYYESSTTDVSQRVKNGESDYDSSDTESKAPGTKSSSRSMPKGQESVPISSSQASVSLQRSASSLGKTHSEERSRQGLYEDQKSLKQSMGPGSATATAPDPPGPGVCYKIPVGKKNVLLTVHEVVELSNRITDIVVLEIIDELITHGLYIPPSSRYLQEPGTSMPRTSVEADMKSKSLRQKVNKQREFDASSQSTNYKAFNEEERMKTTQPPSTSSRIDESSSRAGISKGSSRKDGSAEDIKHGEKQRSGESRRSSCPRHSKSLSPSNSSRRRSPSCRLEIERRARSEGNRYDDPKQPQGDVGPPTLCERRLSSQIRAEMIVSSRARAQSTDMPGSSEALMNSQNIKTLGSYKSPSTQHDQASLRGSSVESLSKIQPTLLENSQKIIESSQRSSTQCEGPSLNNSNVLGSCGASMSSQMSKTRSHRASSTRPDQASLKDGSLLTQQPTLPRSRQSEVDRIPRTSKQYETPPQDMWGVPESRGASMSSKTSKIGSYRASSTQNDQSSLKFGSSPGRSMPVKTDSSQSDMHKGSSLSGDRIGTPNGQGKVPCGPQTPKQGSKTQFLLKDSSVPESSQKRTEIDEKSGPGQDVNGIERIPNGSQILTARQQSNNASSGPRIAYQDIINQPASMSKKEVFKDELFPIKTKEKVYTTESEGTDASAIRGISQQSPVPCQPDEFIATDYDTDNSVLYYARITSNAFPPVKETYHAAGFMLRSAYKYSIPPRSKMNIKTDLLLQLPRNSYGRIAPRKCLVENYGIDVGADVIDRDFRGNITVVLFNHGDRTFTVERGNKVAQLICESIHLAKVVENSDLLKS